MALSQILTRRTPEVVLPDGVTESTGPAGDPPSPAGRVDPVPPSVVMAEVTPFAALGAGWNRRLPADEDWQTRGRRYDREGPGIVGAALDIPAATATLVDLVVQQFTGGEWATVNDPTLETVLRMWRGRTQTQTDLLRRLVRTLDGPGEGYLVLRHEPGGAGWWWQIAQTSNVAGQDGQVIVKTRPDAQPGSRWHTVVPESHVTHFHVEDPEWEGLAWSPLRRGLPDLEKYRTAIRTVGRNLDSQLAMNGVLWAKAVVDGVDWQSRLTKWASKAYTSDGGVETVAPFMIDADEPPEWVDIGRSDHLDQLKVADEFLVAFCRAMDTPTKMLHDGPGTSNHWGDYIVNDYYADFTMFPRLARACSIVTMAHLRPWVKALRVTSDYDAEKLRVWFDDTRVRSKTDNTDRVLELGRRGIATREAQARAAGLADADVVELPPGITEPEWSALLQGVNRLEAIEAQTDEFQDGAIRPGVRADNPGEPVRAGLDPEAEYWDRLTP